MADYLLAQVSVLGSMLMVPETVGDVVTTLRPEDFTEETGRQIFRAIRDLYLSDGKIDPVTVLNKMGPPNAEYRKYMLAVMENTPTAANLEAWLSIVRSSPYSGRSRALA